MQIHAYCQQKNGFRTDAEGIEVGWALPTLDYKSRLS